MLGNSQSSLQTAAIADVCSFASQQIHGLAEDDIPARQLEYGKNVLLTDEGVNWVQLILGLYS